MRACGSQSAKSGTREQFSSVRECGRRFEERRTGRRPRPIFGLAMHAPPPQSPPQGKGLIAPPRHSCPAAPACGGGGLLDRGRYARFLFLFPSLHFRVSESSVRAAGSTIRRGRGGDLESFYSPSLYPMGLFLPFPFGENSIHSRQFCLCCCDVSDDMWAISSSPLMSYPPPYLCPSPARSGHDMNALAIPRQT